MGYGVVNKKTYSTPNPYSRLRRVFEVFKKSPTGNKIQVMLIQFSGKYEIHKKLYRLFIFNLSEGNSGYNLQLKNPDPPTSPFKSP